MLANSPSDRIFVYYSDHGAPGIVGMPSGPFLYADELNKVSQTDDLELEVFLAAKGGRGVLPAALAVAMHPKHGTGVGRWRAQAKCQAFAHL